MKVGTIGSGVIVDRMIEALKNEGHTVVAVYSRTEEKGKAFADQHGVKKVYTDLDEMLADPDVEVVYVASPNALHVPQTKKALEAGKDVITEKPFAGSKKEAEEVFELAEEKGKHVFEAITTVYMPNFINIKDNLDMVGTVANVNANFSQYSSKYGKFLAGEDPNVFTLEYDGGALMDINVYNIHFVTGLFGRPEKVTYFPRKGRNGIDVSGTLILEYPDFDAVLIGAKDSSSPGEAFIQGEKGTIEVTNGSVGRCRQVNFIPPVGDMIGKQEEDNKEDMTVKQNPNHMDYEVREFDRIMREGDKDAYEKAKAQTLMVMEIIEEAKRQRDGR